MILIFFLLTMHLFCFIFIIFLKFYFSLIFYKDSVIIKMILFFILFLNIWFNTILFNFFNLMLLYL